MRNDRERVGQEPEAIDLNVSEAVWDNLPHEMPTAGQDEVILHGKFPQQKQVRAIISQDAVAQIAAHANSDFGREVGGALLGRAMRHQAQTFVEVLAAMPASSNDHGPVHFTFTADTWANINRQREAQYPDLGIVGWFHTHPNLGVFYSSDDVVVHSAAFTLPWQIGLVVDPVRHEACFFGWEETKQGQEILPIAGFYEWQDRQKEPMAAWEVNHHQHWAEPLSEAFLPAILNEEMPASLNYWTFFMSGISLLISLGLLLERLLNQ